MRRQCGATSSVGSQALDGLVLGVVVEEVDGADLVENTLGLQPSILDSWVARAIDNVLHTDLSLFEVVSGESRLLVSQLNEDQVGKERSQGSLSEGDHTHEQPGQGDNLQEGSKLDRLVVVGSDKVTNLLGKWVGLWDVQSRQDKVLGVGQNVESGEQEEHQQGQQDVRRSNEKQHTQEQVLSVILSKQLGVEAVLLDSLEEQHTETLNDTNEGQTVPELVTAWEHLHVSKGVEDGGHHSDHMANVPGKLEGLHGGSKVLLWTSASGRRRGRGGVRGASGRRGSTSGASRDVVGGSVDFQIRNRHCN